MLPERKRLTSERQERLRGNPERRRGVTNAVAIAAVGAPELREVAECSRRRLRAGSDKTLDCHRGRLSVRSPSLRRLEAAVSTLEPPQKSDCAGDRRAPYAGGTQGLGRVCRVIGVRAHTAGPRE